MSKRLRFEILRRDNHQCRYCGARAPETPLTVDHVVPDALGGSDDPANLVAACVDCNGGKSSMPADASVVADVASDAVRWSAAIRQAADEMALHDNTEVYEAVVNAWTSFRRNQIPADYRETIDQFLKAGLPADDIVQMAHVADAKPNAYDRWAYFCGCCWTRIRKLQERAAEIISPSDHAVPQGLLTTIWSADEIERELDSAIASAYKWCDQEVIACVSCRHRDRGHCGDPVCEMHYATTLLWLAMDRQGADFEQFERDEAVMAEAEELDG